MYGHHGYEGDHEALRMSEERFRELADLLPILVYEYGPDGKLTFGNRALLEFHGLENE
jgi:PAS domain-containing protein